MSNAFDVIRDVRLHSAVVISTQAIEQMHPHERIEIAVGRAALMMAKENVVLTHGILPHLGSEPLRFRILRIWFGDREDHFARKLKEDFVIHVLMECIPGSGRRRFDHRDHFIFSTSAFLRLERFAEHDGSLTYYLPINENSTAFELVEGKDYCSQVEFKVSNRLEGS